MKNYYQFYFYYKIGGKKYITETRECIRPEQTKVYKELKISYNCGFIEQYGYKLVKP